MASIEDGDGVGGGDQPGVDEVLYSLRQAPFTYDDLREFMESEYNQENLDFWGRVEEYRQTFEDAQAPKMVRVSSRKPTDPNSESKGILQEFVEVGSPNEVNISGQMREEIVKKTQAGESRGIFDSAQMEIRRIISSDTFPRFLQRVVRTNITDSQANWRKHLGYFLIFLGIVVTGVVIGLEFADIVGFPYLRFLNLPFFINGLGYYISGKQKV